MSERNIQGDVNVQFEEPTSRINLDSGSSVKTLFGRISKWLKDLKPVAFSGSYNDLSNKPTTGVSGVKGNSETTYRTGNVNLTPANIGLGNVNNTSDANKPISTAAQAALDNKLDTTGGSTYSFSLNATDEGLAEKSSFSLDTMNAALSVWHNIAISNKTGQITLSCGNFDITLDSSGIRMFDNDRDNGFFLGNTGPTIMYNGTKVLTEAFRGKDLTNVYTIDQMYSMIHSGKFDDLFLGDYFTKSMTTDIYTRFTGTSFASGTVYYEMGGTLTNRTWTATTDTTPQTGKVYATKTTKTENVTLMFAAFDYYYNVGDTALTTHHAVLIPRGYGFATAAKMNSSNTTVGSYFNSDMHQIVLPCYAKALKTVLNNHLLAHRTILPNAINASTPSMAGAGFTGASTNWAWVTTELQLMTEQQVYGTRAWTSSVYDIGIDYRILPVFNFINPVLFGRSGCWLRSVVSSTGFAGCSGNGNASGNGASDANYVRPLILFG